MCMVSLAGLFCEILSADGMVLFWQTCVVGLVVRVSLCDMWEIDVHGF